MTQENCEAVESLAKKLFTEFEDFCKEKKKVYTLEMIVATLQAFACKIAFSSLDKKSAKELLLKMIDTYQLESLALRSGKTTPF